MLEATIDEVADLGVDVHLLQPGLCNVPLWNSAVYPLAEHAAWLKQRYGQKLDPFAQFVLDGNDLIQIFIDRCRTRGQSPFISFRLNDAHHKEFVDARPGDKVSGLSQSVTKLYVEHPEWRLGPELGQASERVWNWSIPEVRSHQLAMLRELCTAYDFEGLELDFLRYPSYFDLQKTTVVERKAIMTDFVRDVRRMLDSTGKVGRRRWLCARVPCYLNALDDIGVDLHPMVEAGLDMVNASSTYYTTQRQDLASMRRRAQGASLFFEICHTTWTGPKVASGYDASLFRRTTVEQFQTTAHLAYARGCDGVSTFNFVYYREHGKGDRGPFHEPPFAVLKYLGDSAWLANQPQHWFIAKGWRPANSKPTPVPRTVAIDKPARFVLDLASPAGGWKNDGRVRIEAELPLGDRRWTAKLNDAALSPTNDVSEPYAAPYPSLLGEPSSRRAWSVPVSALRDGMNRLDVTLAEGEPATIVWVDLAVNV
jgi:hypothetical protein